MFSDISIRAAKLRFVLLLLPAAGAFANYPAQVSVLLDAGEKTVSISNSGSAGQTQTLTFSPGPGERVRFTISPIYAPPSANSTYSACSAPCGISINRQWGQQYYWVEYVDNSGNSFSPAKVSQAAGAYDTLTCGGLGTLPMVEPPVTAVSPLPMPREIIGQDCYVDRVRLPLQSGHAATGVQLFARIHSPGSKTIVRADGKLSLQINGGAWITLTNDNPSLRRVDELRYWSVKTTGAPGTSDILAPLPIGGYAQVADYIIDIPNGAIGLNDTTAEIAWRFNGTEGITSGSRILEMALIEGSHRTLTNIAVTSNSAAATSNSHGLGSNDDVMIWGAPGMRMVFNGPRHISAVTTNTFTFSPCGAGSGGSKTTTCASPNGNYAPPVNRNLATNPNDTIRKTTEQAFMYAARMLVAKSAFTYTDPSGWTAPASGNASRGNCLIEYGNTTCTPGQFDQLANPATPYLNYTFHFAKCGSCHSPTMADLKYYNYSNHSIEQRTYFHGLSAQDGLDIAAAIRGNAIAVPTQARPWNPPLQTGPGMSNGTFRRSDSTLTRLVVSSNVGTVTTGSAHNLKTGDFVCFWGATVDTDINTLDCPTITVTGSTTFTLPTVNVANGTYNESTLALTMPNDAFAGCGVDCVSTYGYETLDSYGSPANWAWNSRIDAWNIIYQWQFPDWNSGWLPTFFPTDAVPSSGYLTSTPYTSYVTLLGCMTKGDFTTYKSCGYGFNLFPEWINYWGRDEDVASENPPNKTNKFTRYHVPTPWVAPSQYNLFRQSLIQTNGIAQWTLSNEWKALGLNYQRMTDVKGPATATGCYLPWGIAGLSFVFNIGSHKVTMDIRSIIDGNWSTYNYASNIWYVMALAINGGDCYDTPDNPVDNAYLYAFLQAAANYRSSGWALSLVPPLLTPQLGNQNTEFYQYSGDQRGTDWTPAIWEPLFGLTGNVAAYYWYTPAQLTYLVNAALDWMLAITSAKSPTYWENVFTNSGNDGLGNTNVDCLGAASAYSNGGLVCADIAIFLTYAKLWGGNATKIDNLKAWAESINLPSWNAHDFAADIAAAQQGDSPGTTTGNLSTPGSGKVVTFSACPALPSTPNAWFTITGTGAGENYEATYPTGGTCSVIGNPGTLEFTTIRPHTGTLTVRRGCSSVDPKPNYQLGGSADSTYWFRCSNMF